jgi:cytochrome P450 PksS
MGGIDIGVSRRIALDRVILASRAFKADPYPVFARFRAEAPVCRVRAPDPHPTWLVTRYEDVVALLKDERFIKDQRAALTPEQKARQPWIPSALRPLQHNMLDLDPPDHTRLRGLVHKAFTPRLVENLRGRVQEITDGLLDAVQARGRMELMRDFALPLPSIVIAELLGVPARDRHRFHRWSTALLMAPATTWGLLRVLPTVLAFMRYLRKLIAARRAVPSNDLAGALVQARESGDALSEDELLAMFVLLLIAGHETTVNLIGNGTLALLRHPDQLGRLREDPELIRPGIEELLRYDGPLLTATDRYAREDAEIGGVTIPRGERVFAALASADRDERQFENPDELDLTRDPNRHVAFGLGVHYCVGAPLARLEGQIAITTLLRRFPGLQLASPPDSLRRRPGLVLNSLEALPVTVSRRASPALHRSGFPAWRSAGESGGKA